MDRILAADGRYGLAPTGARIRAALALLALCVGAPPAPCAAADLLDRLAEPGAAAAARRPDEAGAPPSSLRPRVHRTLSASSFRNLRLGFVLALEMVRTSRTCRALFDPLAGSGVESLAATHYAATTDRDRARVCAGGVAAFTTVGGRVTWLCPEFGNLHPRTAALTLVHEALHSAGMPEDPAAAGALTAGQIDDLVEGACAPGAARRDATAGLVARR